MDIEISFGTEGDDLLSSSGYIQDTRRLDRLRNEVTGDPQSIITLWTEEFKMTKEEMVSALEEEIGIFGAIDLTKLDPSVSLCFWLDHALIERNQLSATVWNKNGDKRYSISVEKAHEYSKLPDINKASPDQELSAIVVTLAKLEAVIPIMTDVYPGLHWEAISESRQAMKELLHELSEESMSTLKRRLLVATLSSTAIITLIIAACASSSATKTELPASSTKPRIIKASTPSESVPAIDADGFYADWVNKMMCKDPEKPYFAINYVYPSPTPDCLDTRIKPPLQVMAEEDCPPNTTRHVIYQYEGGEAVCLPKEDRESR